MVRRFLRAKQEAINLAQAREVVIWANGLLHFCLRQPRKMFLPRILNKDVSRKIVVDRLSCLVCSQNNGKRVCVFVNAFCCFIHTFERRD